MDRRGFLGLLSGTLARKALARDSPPESRNADTSNAPAAAYYVDVSQQAHLNFRNTFGATKGKRYLLETTGCGVAWIDYDRDGFPDLFLVNGTTIDARFPPGSAPTNQLFHNNGDGTFTDVTTRAGLAHTGWGQGVCVGDYDSDGWDDLFVTCYGKNLLYHNNGNGTFTELAERAGVAGDAWRWNTGCVFVDYDRDGRLDLFVANYVDQGRDFHLLPQPGSGQFCEYKGVPMACGPRGLTTGRNFLYHNNGDGTFTDVSEKAGIILLPDKHYALGATSVDYDNDGWPDLYVACDSTASILYHNNHDGSFTDQAFVAGVAYSGDGEAQAGMGIAIADCDHDGNFDIAKTNFSDDTPDLYHNNGDGTFSDVTFAAGLGSHPNLMGWGIGFIDFDHDGWPDVFMANGHLDAVIDQYHIDSVYAEPKLLYRNVRAPGDARRFEDVSNSSGPGITTLSSSRGIAFADYDHDGQLEIAINNMNGPACLLKNSAGVENCWIQIKAVGVESNRSGIGTRIEIRTGEGRQTDEIRSGSSYISQHALAVHFGVGEHTRIDEITLRWPSGRLDQFHNVPSNQAITIREGRGIVEKWRLRRSPKRF